MGILIAHQHKYIKTYLTDLILILNFMRISEKKSKQTIIYPMK